MFFVVVLLKLTLHRIRGLQAHMNLKKHIGQFICGVGADKNQ